MWEVKCQQVSHEVGTCGPCGAEGSSGRALEKIVSHSEYGVLPANGGRQVDKIHYDVEPWMPWDGLQKTHRWWIRTLVPETTPWKKKCREGLRNTGIHGIQGHYETNSGVIMLNHWVVWMFHRVSFCSFFFFLIVTSLNFSLVQSFKGFIVFLRGAVSLHYGPSCAEDPVKDAGDWIVWWELVYNWNGLSMLRGHHIKCH